MHDQFVLSDDNAIHDHLEHLLFGGKGRINKRLLNRRTNEFGALNQAQLIFAVIALVLKVVQSLNHMGAVDLNLLTALLEFLNCHRLGLIRIEQSLDFPVESCKATRQSLTLLLSFVIIGGVGHAFGIPCME